MSYIYLAAPYTHKDPKITYQRFVESCKAAAYLMKKCNTAVFSPIAHSHPIGIVMNEDYSTPEKQKQCGKFWKNQDTPLLVKADELYVLCLDKWERSKGIKWEIELARALDKPIIFMEKLNENEYEFINDFST